MKSAATFWDRAAPRYASKPIANEEAYRRKIEVTRQYLEPHMTVLEIGCGTGSTAIVHAPFVKHITATDFSPKMIETGRERAKAHSVDNISFEVCAAENLSLESQSLDAVLALNVLHLLENRSERLMRIYQALKEGGTLITSTACLGDMKGVFKFVLPIVRFFGLIPPISVFVRQQLESELTHAGFSLDYIWQPDKNQPVFIVAKKKV